MISFYSQSLWYITIVYREKNDFGKWKRYLRLIKLGLAQVLTLLYSLGGKSQTGKYMTPPTLRDYCKNKNMTYCESTVARLNYIYMPC